MNLDYTLQGFMDLAREIEILKDSVIEVQALITPPKSMYIGQLGRSLSCEGVLDRVLSERLTAVPGIFHLCSSAIRIESLAVHFTRGVTERRVRHHNCDVLDRMADVYDKRDLTVDILVHAWRSYVHRQQAHRRHDAQLGRALSQWNREHKEIFLHICLREWHTEILYEHKRQKELLNGDLAEAMDKHALAMSEAERKLDAAQKRHELMVDRIQNGENRGLTMAVFTDWHKYVIKALAVEKKIQAVTMQLRKWMEGEAAGSLHLVYISWHKHAVHDRAGRQAENERRQAENEKKHMSDMLHGKLGEANEANAMKLSEAERRHEAAKQSVELAVRKWEAGDVRGLKSEVFTAWHKFIMQWVAYRKRQADVEVALHKFLEGGAQGSLHTVVLYWHKFVEKRSGLRRDKASTEMALKKFMEGDRMGLMHGIFMQWEAHKNYAKIHGWHNSKLDHSKQDMDNFLSNTSEQHQAELAAQKAAHEAEPDRQHACVENAQLAWLAGESKALSIQFFMWWKKHSQHAKDIARKRQSVHDALLVAVMGETRAAIQLTFTNWAHDAQTAKLQKQADQQLKEESARIDDFVKEVKSTHGQELERHLSEFEMRKERAHEGTQLVLRQWEMGSSKGLTSTVMYEWKRLIQIQRDLERRHEATKLAVMSWLEGNGQADVHICFTHWLKEHQLEMQHRAARNTILAQNAVKVWRIYTTRMHVAREKAGYLHQKVLIT